MAMMEDVTASLSPDSSATAAMDSALSAVPASFSTSIDLYLQYKHIDMTLPIPSTYFTLLQYQKSAFLHSISSLSSTSNIQTSAELALAFIEFLLSQPNVVSSALAALLRAFDYEFLTKTDIHSLVAELSPNPEQRRHWLRIYYVAVNVQWECGPEGKTKIVGESRSSFFQNAETKHFQLMAVFGGQGDASRTCIHELSELYATYQPMLQRFLRTLGSKLADLSRLPECRLFYQGRHFDIETWVTDATTIPDVEFVASAPVSVPLIGLLSLARYSVTCQILGLSPGELRERFCATTGHSQGLLISIAIAVSDSWESFHDTCRLTLEALFWLGWECHHHAPRSITPAVRMTSENDDGEYDISSYMLSVRGATRNQIDDILSRINRCLPSETHLYLSLVNARDQFVVAGPISSLTHLDSYLRAESASGAEQNRIPFGSRIPFLQHEFLSISTPFHTPYLRAAVESMKTRFADRKFPPQQLLIPVYHTRTGQDLREANEDILHLAFDAIAREICDWPTAIASPSDGNARRPFVSHIVVFDRGGLGSLVKKIKEGQGVRVIQAADLDSRDPEIGTMKDLFSPYSLESSAKSQAWGQRFQPRLTTGVNVGLETRLTRLLGTPPIMVAGMTPTTVHWDFVSAIMNAGYHAELAGGGHYNAPSMASAIYNLARSIPAGRGITCNLIYANPRAIKWQVALLHRLSQKGVPIDGLTLGAGVPSLEVVTEYIQTLGLRHISFKPGSIEAIRHVIDIAKAHPDFPVILQWTGGRAGGHHSYEDFHDPIVSTYGSIRQQPNIYLVAGSGFGSGDSIYPYLTGSWSVPMGYAPMPFDGVLLGSCMMIASEAHTSQAVKNVITATPGVKDHEWEKTYQGPAGGVITVKSEMGEPIHKIANRGVLLWADMDKTVFNLPRKDRVAYLTEHRNMLVNRLNADFAKPWFGRNLKGDAVNLKEMTYMEVLTRLVDLMYIQHQQRWIDPSYVRVTFEFAIRTLERLPANLNNLVNLSQAVLREDPARFLRQFATICAAAAEDLLHPEDVSFFLMQTKKDGQKPVNFIPILNDDFEFYFKKDSLWQSEDIDAVIDQDAGRVCILHGPVAAQYSCDRGQSAKEILDTIITTLIAQLQRDMSTEELTIGIDSGLVTPDSWSTVSPGVKEFAMDYISTPSSTTVSEPTDEQPIYPATFCYSPGRNGPAWVQAVLNDKFVIQGGIRQRNPFCEYVEACPEPIIYYNSNCSEISILVRDHFDMTSTVKIACHNGVDVNVEVHPPYQTDALRLFYRFNPSSVPALDEVIEGRNQRIKSFYSKLWFGEDSISNRTVHDTFYGPSMLLTRELIETFTKAVGAAFPDHRTTQTGSDILPISVGIILAWDVMSRPLVLGEIEGDLLRLVHRSNTFEYAADAAPLRLGETISSQSRVQAILIEDAGKVAVVEGHIIRSGKPVLTLTSTFLIRGSFDKVENTFQRVKLSDLTLHLPSNVEEEVLKHRKWFHPLSCLPSLVNKTVIFNVESHVTYKENGHTNLRVNGSAHCRVQGHELRQIADVGFTCDDCLGNPVLEFLERKGAAKAARTDFSTPGWSGQSSFEVRMPASNQDYAQASKDLNPIHVSTIFAKLAQLPGTLSHGMYTSAIVNAVLEHLVVQGNRARIRRFSAKFLEMVMPSEKLSVSLQHTGMVEGRMRFAVGAFRMTNGEKVLDAEAEVEQPATAYLFTGQGSQSKGMGMDLYNTSRSAKALWDDIDAHLYNAYGWSILDIVRDNPKTLRVHFGGKQGRKIRQNYLSITTETELPNGVRTQEPVLGGLTPTSTSYTFHDPRGLLYSTQFAQPTILLFEAAAFAEMRARGYVSREAMYAGHSLGEYGALSALSKFVPTSTLVELAFYRGLMMQASVARDGEGGTTYGMVAANPRRVGNSFDQSSLSTLVRMIVAESRELLEIVNFNVDGEQYVCSGTTTNLHVLGKVLDHIAQCPSGPKQVQEANDSTNASTTELHSVIHDLLSHARTLPNPIDLQRGKATIPLQGIDVPFHSSHLRSTVDMFRQCLLRAGLLEGNIDFAELEGKYIPNLVAKPFSLDEEYIRQVFELTRSPILGEILGL